MSLAALSEFFGALARYHAKRIERFVTIYGSEVRRFAVARLPCAQRAADGDDVYQETLVALAERYAFLDDRALLALSWAIAKRTAGRHAKRAKRERLEKRGGELERVASTASHSLEHEEFDARKAEICEARAAGHITSQQAEILLADLESEATKGEHETALVAKRLGILPKTAVQQRSRAHRALKRVNSGPRKATP